ncbi:MAG: hypothetical protein LBR07_04305 [Puniceicoccales bacterium]|jgi:hypothetical protein|nr:hypothetical protein [Puniceicoccales bacterium]
MSNEPESAPQERVISLQAISQNFLGAVQRQFDLLSYNLAAAQQVSAENYENFAHLVKIMPVGQLHQNFALVRDYARELLVRQTLNDLVNMSAACMDNCHLLCLLIREQDPSKPAGGAVAEDVQKRVQERQNAFARASLNEKFEALERDFGIMCGTEDALIALAIGLRSLVVRDGEVTKEDVNEDEELVFEFKTVQVIAPPADAAPDKKPEVRVVDTRRTFRVGDRIELSNSELLGLSVTVTAFFHDLFQSVDDFGTKTLGKKPAAGAAAASGQ